MTRGERRFLLLTPAPLLLSFYHVLPLVQGFRFWLGWLPQTIRFGLSLVLIVVGICFVVRALRTRRLRYAVVFLLGTLLGGIPGFGLLAIFILINTGGFAIHQ